MYSPIELLFEYFSISTLIGILSFGELLGYTPIVEPYVNLLIINTFVLIIGIYQVERDIYNYISEKTTNTKYKKNIIISPILIGIVTLVMYKSGVKPYLVLSLVQLIWSLLVSIVWSYLPRQKTLNKTQKKKKRNSKK